MKKIIILTIIFLIINNSILSINVDSIDNKLKDEYNNLDVKYCDNENYKFGIDVGDKFSHFYHIIVLTCFNLQTLKNKENLLLKANALKEKYQEYAPDLIDEYKGLSESTGIAINKLIATNIFIKSIIKSGCTTTISTGNATLNNDTFLTQNIDITLKNDNAFLNKLKIPSIAKILLIKITRMMLKFYFLKGSSSGNKYMILGLPGIYEHIIMNDKGLGFGCTGLLLTENKSREIDHNIEGIPTKILIKNTLQKCQNVSEVEELWKNTIRSSDKNRISPNDYDFFTTAWCDRDGRILIIEQSHSYLCMVSGNSTDITKSKPNILWHTNYHQWLDPNLTGSQYPGEENQEPLWGIVGYRSDRAQELLEFYWGNITLNECINITRDHGGGIDIEDKDSSDICHHPDDKSMCVTTFAYIVQPKNLNIYWTKGSPCKKDFIKHDFSELFLNTNLD